MNARIERPLSVLPLALLIALTAAAVPGAQSRPAPAPQRVDAEYTARIKEYLQDPRITTELVDHLPASDTVPTPLAFHGRIVGTRGPVTDAWPCRRCR